VIYCVKVKASAAKALKKIAIKDRERLIVAIDALSTNPAAGGVLKGEFSGLRRLRVGDYRIVYEINGSELIVLVIRIGHRQGVYR
jgi:mRNA interferase RelE/StbE